MSLQSKCKQKPSTSLGKEVPMHPWTKFVTDILLFEGAYYLLVVDYTSRFLTLHKLSSMTSVQIANQCKLIFSEYGCPETLISDNGPCYTSQTIPSVMKSYDINHITSAPHDLQSKRLTENMSRLLRACSTNLRMKVHTFKLSYDLHHYHPIGSK